MGAFLGAFIRESGTVLCVVECTGDFFLLFWSARTLYRGGNRFIWVLLGGLILEYDKAQLLGCATPT